MDNKYIELEKWENLKKSGVITEAEFEDEKNKLLNENRRFIKENTIINNRIKFSKLIFIICIILLVISIIFFITSIKHESDASVDLKDEIEYELAKELYDLSGKYKYINEMEKIKNKMEREEMIGNFYYYGTYFFGGATVILFVVGIVIKVKEKGGIKIVN